MTFDSDRVSANEIDSWIEIAETYAGSEKAFVDDLVAHNAGTLDLEMGLPANTAERTAPRMDLVLAQQGGLVFWEAKCSDNSELRSRSAYKESPDGAYASGIKVIHQLRTYGAWMETGDCERKNEVARAYREVASMLTDLAERLEAPGENAREVWREIASGPEMQAILPQVLSSGTTTRWCKDATLTSPGWP